MRAVALFLAAAAAGAVGCGGGGDEPLPPQPQPIVRAVADAREAGRAVPQSFLGFSQDPQIAPFETGFVDQGVNHVLVALYKHLSAPGGGPPLLRIGGNGQDSAWWNPNERPRPRGITIDIGHEYLESLRRFLEATDSRVILGLNLAAGRPELMTALARAAREALPAERIAGFELGNEPHVFPERIQYADAQGREVPSRPPGYSFDDYLPELSRAIDAVRRLGPLAAPGFCCSPWLEELPRLLRRHGDDLATVALHRYPLEACGKQPGQPGYPDAAMLMAPDVMDGTIASLEPAVHAARAAGAEVRLTETNSVACAGGEQVSDRFVAALWAVDWMFNLAAIGVDGVNFHESSPLYQAYESGWIDGGYQATVKPLYYGMLLFAEATPHRAMLLPAAHTEAQARPGVNVQVWATADPVDGVVRVVAVNKSLTSGAAEIEVPTAAGDAQLRRLAAPEPLATTGVTWAGRTFATPTLDGRLTGDEAVETVPLRGTHFRFELPAASAAMLTVKVG